MSAQVAMIMGSKSDWPIMEKAANILKEFEIPFEARVLSAHRTPDACGKYAEEARGRGVKVLIAGAGGAAALAGVLAAHSPLPVLGVPIPSPHLKGMDSLLSTVQMPKGIPVGSLAIGDAGVANAAILAASILALSDERVANKLDNFRKAQSEKVLATDLDY